ncbi:uncharacterized protein [Rhodnius prolixus]|uniref:Uncharacterized protein n=2 Tax=Rhodnius TaxID=13248 RepID=T1HXB7_RHOPR
MTSTIVETVVVEDRLRPLESTSVLKAKTVEDPKTNHLNNKYLLMRTTSFDRLRQFPTYFCRQSSAEIAEWLSTSKIKLSSYLKLLSRQFHGVLLAISVYSAVALLIIQMIYGMVTLLQVNPPSGMLFLIGCIVLVACLAVFIMDVNKITRTNRKSRSRISRLDEKKIA